MLTSYLASTQRLLQTPQSPTPLYSPADLTAYLNEARNQVAGESKSIRVMGALAITAGNRGPYAFSAITLGGATGVAGPIAINTAWYVLAGGQVWMRARPFEWYSLFELNDVVPQSGPPRLWSQFGQGANGTLYFNLPDLDYTIRTDMACLPVPLTDDATPEAIPPLWQSAVPYFAAYLALLGSQTGLRTQQADEMLKRYEAFAQRARQFATPEVAPFIYSQVPSPTLPNQLGISASPARQGGG
jgi:hypothetical protein